MSSRMKHSSKYAICSIALLLGLADGESSNENWGWNSVDDYLTPGKQQLDSTTTATTTTTWKRGYRQREWKHKTFEDFIDGRVLKSSKRGSSSSSSSSSILTKSSKKSKRSYRRPVMQMIAQTARPAPLPTPPPSIPGTPPPTPPPTEWNDDGVDDDTVDDDDALGTSVTFPPGHVLFPRDEDTQYGIGTRTVSPVVETELSTGSPEPTPPPTLHPLLRPMERIDEFTRLVPDNAQHETAPTNAPNHDETLSPTVYLFRHRNHHSAFQTESIVQEGRNFAGPMGSQTIAVEGNIVDSSPSNHMTSGSVLFLRDEHDTYGNPTETTFNGEVSNLSSPKPNCRSSLCSTRTKSNQNHFCCNPSECRQENIIYPLPSFRYGNWRSTVYTNLTMLYFADVFGYTEATWEMPGSNPVEQGSFMDVPDQELLVYMGVSSFQYDCWFNHYQSYSWDELDCYGLADAYVTLGWDASTWGTIHWATWSLREEHKWDELSSAEQDAARKLCYFPALWNGETLSDWSQDWMLDAIGTHDRAHTNQTATEVSIEQTESPTQIPSDTPTRTVSSPPSGYISDESSALPSMLPSMLPTERDSIAPSTNDSHMPSVFPSGFPTVMSSTSPSVAASERPSPVPSASPSQSITISQSCLSSACSNRTTENVGEFCCGTDACDRKSIVLPIPTFRWYSWDSLDDPLKGTARELGYTKDLWNHPGAYELERWSFGFLSEPNQQNILELGFTPQTWDCWQNHYQDYSWEELTCFGLEWAAEALGWTGSSWSNHGPPVLDRKDWASLSFEERSAARELCYLPALWEHTPLDQWNG